MDLMFSRPEGFPHVYRNEGGTFTALPGLGPDTTESLGRPTLAQAAADLDGDRLPELLLVGEGFAALVPNLGEFSFGDAQLLHFQWDYPHTCYQSGAFGDWDRDGDLDLVLPGLDPVPSAGFLPDSLLPESGTWGLLLRNDGEGAWVEAQQVGPAGQPWLSMLAAWTDRDADGDLDLLLAADRSRDGRPGLAFYRNDGAGALVNDAPAIGAEIHSCTMGFASLDLDGDGRLDYCLSDILPELRCLLAGEGGIFYEGGAALGLVAHIDEHPDIEPADAGAWSPWSLEAVDLDNDGWPEMAAAAGAPPGPGGVADSFVPALQPDALWQGGPDGFVDRSWELGFADDGAQYGMASLDLDQDGARELVLGAWGGPVRLWENPCRAGAWITVRLDGTPGNRDGFGARVTVSAGGRTQIQELHSLRTVGQSAPELHFGLGEVERVDELRVRWPDGAESVHTDLTVRAHVIVRHPGR
jgi:hypothetical protein